MTGDTINIRGGDYRKIDNKGTYVEGNYYNNSQEKQSLAEAASEIQELLKQLEESYPTQTLTQKAVVAEEALKKIEADANWKQRVISGVKAMGIEAFMELIDNPVANILRAGIEGFIEAEGE